MATGVRALLWIGIAAVVATIPGPHSAAESVRLNGDLPPDERIWSYQLSPDETLIVYRQEGQS